MINLNVFFIDKNQVVFNITTYDNFTVVWLKEYVIKKKKFWK